MDKTSSEDPIEMFQLSELMDELAIADCVRWYEMY